MSKNTSHWGEPGTPLIVDLCINLAKLKNKGLEELCLTTNGSLLSKFAEPLRRAGVDRLNVSLDTPSAELYKEMTRGGDIEDVFAGLKKAREVGFTGTKINAVLINDFNDLDLRTLSEWTRKYPIDVRWIELMPIGEAAEWHKESFLSCETVLTVIPELEYVGEKGVATLYRFPDGKGHVFDDHQPSLCSTCGSLSLTADGYLKTCLHSRGEIQLRGLSGNELKAAFRRAAADKPWEHHLNERGVSDTIRYMNQIGG